MGWGYARLSDGREVGYSIQATCEDPGCINHIDRGLSYVCGTMHGDTEFGCGHYFCTKHLHFVEFKNGTTSQVCAKCLEFLEKEGLLSED